MSCSVYISGNSKCLTKGKPLVENNYPSVLIPDTSYEMIDKAQTLTKDISIHMIM